jgi:3-dehydroquinate dehydratase II
MQIQIINGPNLNLLGAREPSIYGTQSFADYFKILQSNFPNITLHYYQSNVEGELINYIHQVGFIADGIIINAGGYSHTSVAIADAIKAVSAKMIEVHISNIHSREAIRHHSITGANCAGIISGLGLQGYALAVQYFVTNAIALYTQDPL